MNFWHTLSLLLHLVALALWLGGIAFFLVVVGPALHEIEPGKAIRLLNQGRIAFEAVSWAGIALVMVTGMVNLVLRNQETNAHLGQHYMILLSIKLLLFVTMLLHHSLQVFKYAPKISALTGQTDTDITSWPDPLQVLWKKWFMLLKINATLGPIAILLGIALIKA